MTRICFQAMSHQNVQLCLDRCPLWTQSKSSFVSSAFFSVSGGGPEGKNGQKAYVIVATWHSASFYCPIFSAIASCHLNPSVVIMEVYKVTQC